MRSILRVLAAAVMCVGSAVGFAGTAQAEQQLLEGVYSYTEDGGRTGTWTVYPSCVPTVGDLREPLELPVACRLHVAGSPGLTGGDARLVSGLWSYTTPVLRGMKCPDGSTAPTMETFEFDGNTMAGTRTVTHAAVCGLQPAMSKQAFTLAFQEALPIPVDRYPLICEPGGLRRCF